jgi:polyribonucleotide nucleotidyltransferase
MSDYQIVSREIYGKKWSIETGRMAKQANGSVIVRCGETLVFASACMSSSPLEGADFFPLTVDYKESRYAAGKFPGGFYKREGKPSDRETLTSRLIDRPIRPLFPDGFNHEVQILLNVISYDLEHEPDICGMVAAFAALEVSDIPFQGPVGGVRIGRVNGEFVVNPTQAEIEKSTLNLVIAGSRQGINMVEGGAQEESEETLLEALDLAQKVINETTEMIEELRSKRGKEKMPFTPPSVSADQQRQVRELAFRCTADLREEGTPGGAERDSGGRDRSDHRLLRTGPAGSRRSG